jgi:DNA mismatch endonuclease (patch repair protein)
MRANRRRDTQPEWRVRRLLHAAGLRYRVDLSVRLPGMRTVRPDIAFPWAGLAVFIDGCFWHGYPDHKGRPQTNVHYWGPKLRNNAERDQLQTRALKEAGWTVLRFWEHESPVAVAGTIASEYGRLRNL